MDSEDWPPVHLGDVAEELTVGYVGPMASEYVEGGVPFLRSQNILPFRIDFSDVKYITQEFHSKIGKSSLKAGDVVIVRTGKPGTAAVVPESVGELNCSDLVIVRPGDALDSRFLCYHINGVAGYHVRAHLVGAVQQHFNVGSARQLPFRLPPHPEQRRITAVLGALDDKIELNRKMNRTLEAMAQALFKSWFVDFDPVVDNALRAGNPIPDDLADKAERRKEVMARDSYSAPEYAGLFPNRFEDSELGWIPTGWRASTLGKEAERCDGLIQTGPFGSQLHASDYVDVGIPVMMPKNIQNRRISTDGIARITDDDADRLARHRVQEGDLVYSRRGDVEKHALIGPRELGWLCGTGCLLFRAGAGGPSPLYTSLALDQPNIRAWISRHAIGATMPNLNTRILSAVPLIAPPDALIDSFAELTRPMNKRSVANDAESETLSATRDTLLPKLISGEVRVPAGVV